MRAEVAHPRVLRPRMSWARASLAFLLMAGAISVAMVAAPAPADAAPISVEQCNGVGPGVMGATTNMTCTVTVINTIDGASIGSVTTLTRQCGLDPCAPGNGTFVTESTNLVTQINQCNDSDNDAAHPILCTVNVTNRIREGTPQAEPLADATVNQCVGSGNVLCTPFPANTTGATVTQCNGSGNGGGGTVDCSVTPSQISAAIPVRINQCNGTGNPGGSVVTCTARLTVEILEALPSTTTTTSATSSSSSTSATSTTDVPNSPTSHAVPGTPTDTNSATSTSSSSSTSAASSSATRSSGRTATAAAQVARVPSGGVQAGGGSTAGLQYAGMLALGGGLLLAATFVAVRGGRRTQRED